LKIAKEARIICDLYDAQLIINDNVEVALHCDADGIHLGKTDMNPHEARKIMGCDKIIGGTANTIEDVQNLINIGIDYIGLGPFQFTETKKNLNPVLGLNGYKEIIQKLDATSDGFPIIAVGGIDLEDVESLINTGVYGVAVSATITNNFTLIKDFQKLLNKQITNSIL